MVMMMIMMMIDVSGSRVVFNEVLQTSKYYMRDVTAVESAWLVELAPHFYKQAKVGTGRETRGGGPDEWGCFTGIISNGVNVNNRKKNVFEM